MGYLFLYLVIISSVFPIFANSLASSCDIEFGKYLPHCFLSQCVYVSALNSDFKAPHFSTCKSARTSIIGCQCCGSLISEGIFPQSRFTTKDPGPKTLFVSLGQVWLIGGFKVRCRVSSVERRLLGVKLVDVVRIHLRAV